MLLLNLQRLFHQLLVLQQRLILASLGLFFVISFFQKMVVLRFKSTNLELALWRSLFIRQLERTSYHSKFLAQHPHYMPTFPRPVLSCVGLKPSVDTFVLKNQDQVFAVSLIPCFVEKLVYIWGFLWILGSQMSILVDSVSAILSFHLIMEGLNFYIGFKASVVLYAIVVDVFFTHLFVEWPDVYLFIQFVARLNLP